MVKSTRRKILLGVGALSVTALVFAFTMGLSFGKMENSGKDIRLGAESAPITAVPSAVEELSNAFSNVAKAVTPAVVQIQVTTTPKAVTVPDGQDQHGNNMFKFFFGPEFPFHNFNFPQQAPSPEHALGSGVIVNSDGYIITNNHVVQGADDHGIKVTLTDKRTFDAKLVGRDPTTDVAVIKIKGDNLPCVALGNSDSVHVGQWVVAIGNPMGLNYTVTQGIISALGRNINIIQNQYGIEDFIQTDAVINPGNSGGPLVDLQGQVVGINTAIATNTGTYEGYGFAVPINIARKVAEDLISNGKVVRPYMGVQIQDVDETMAKALGMTNARGVLVQSVQSNSPAEESGIKPGDVILKFNDEKIEQANQLQALVASKRPGDKVDVEIMRDGKTKDISVELKERSGETFAAVANGSDNSSANLGTLGLTVQDADKQTLDKYDAKNGVLVTDVASGSVAQSRGIQKGDLITSVDNNSIKSSRDLEKIVDSHKPGDALLFRVTTSAKANEFLALGIPEK
ncbi:MAG TPA: Do family serine endopeptidase [Candidatus Kryptonia bacterium]